MEERKESRRNGRRELEATSPVSVWLLLSSPAAQRDEMYATVDAFCSTRANARRVAAQGTAAGRAYVYVVVDSGDVSGAMHGDDRAVAGLATARAVVSRLFMYEPVFVEEPAGEQSA